MTTPRLRENKEDIFFTIPSNELKKKLIKARR
jgi:hypothetical protein